MSKNESVSYRELTLSRALVSKIVCINNRYSLNSHHQIHDHN